MSPLLRVLLLFCVIAYVTARNTKLREVFSWKQIDYEFPNSKARQAAITSGEFIPKNVLPLAMEVWQDKIFVTFPRRRPGVAATLAYVKFPPGTKSAKSTSPKLIPYPDWDTNKLPEDDAEDEALHIVSTFRVRVDACDRLWVMDTGISDLEGEAKHHVQPRVLIFDLNTDELIKQIPFPEEFNKPDSFFANILVDADVSTGCDNAFAYMSDLGSYAVVVYSFKEDVSWRIQHHFFHFDPLKGNYNVAGVTFQWTDGVFGMALSKRNKGGYRTVFFQNLSGNNLFSVSNRVLQNRTHNSNYNDYKLVGDKGPNTQSTTLFLDEKTGVLFYTLVNQDGIACWNTNERTLTAQNQGLVTSDRETMVYPSDMKGDRNGMLWMLSNRMPFYLYRELSPNQVNFRIFTASVTDALKNTVCAQQSTPVRIDGGSGNDDEDDDQDKDHQDLKDHDDDDKDNDDNNQDHGDDPDKDHDEDGGGNDDDEDQRMKAKPLKMPNPAIWSSR